jgi:circadian clock protein KaiB
MTTSPPAEPEDPRAKTYCLQLYIAGANPRSFRAVANIKTICEEHLQGKYNLEVIDLFQQPHLAEKAQIIAVPTLIKQTPLPCCCIIGDLSDTERVLGSLGLPPRK